MDVLVKIILLTSAEFLAVTLPAKDQWGTRNQSRIKGSEFLKQNRVVTMGLATNDMNSDDIWYS